MIKEAEGQAQAVLKVQQATAEGLPNDQGSRSRSSSSYSEEPGGVYKGCRRQGNKIIIPSEIQGIAGLATSLKEIMTDKTGRAEINLQP